MHRLSLITYKFVVYGLAMAMLTPATSITLVGATSIDVKSAGAFQDSDIAPVQRPIFLYAGSCRELGDIQWPLNSLTSPDGENGGSDDADRTEYSFTANVPLTIDQMLAADFAINVHASGELFEASLSCGNIGGVPDGVGTLVIGLRQQESSGVTGIAVLSPSPANAAVTYISVFIAGRALGEAIGTTGVTPVSGVDESPPGNDDPGVSDDPPADGGGNGDDDEGGDDDDEGGDDDGNDDD